MELRKFGPSGGPLVSVIIPCYKQGHFLKEAIDSVLAQTYPHFELIVVDDGSPDQTREVAARYGNCIRYLQKENAGCAAARNTGILASRGDFLVFLDADDYLAPDTLEKQMAAAQANPMGAVFHVASQYVDLKGRAVSRFEARSLGDDRFHALLADNPFVPHCLLVRRSAFANAGLFDPRLPSSEDWDMWIRLAAQCQFVPVPDGVVYYRFYPTSKSKNSARMWRAGLAILRKNQGRHGNCRLCRRATARGIRRLRIMCFGLLLGELYADKAERGIGASMARAISAVRGDPTLSVWLAGESVRCLSRRCAPCSSGSATRALSGKTGF